jgi:hypothetical protein
MSANVKAGHTEDQEKKSGAGKGWGLMILVVMIGIVIFKFLFLSDKNDNSANKNDNNNHQSSQSHTKTIIVTYGPEYGEAVDLPSGFDYYFEGATEPYCYSNKNGQENCGERGEDATGTFGDTPANKRLIFKSQNGVNGQLKIILTK